MSRPSSNSSNSAVNNIPFIFDRPCEPLFTGREEITFDVPTAFWPDRYKNISSSIQTKFPTTNTGTVVRVSNFTNGRNPDLSEVTVLGRYQNFSIFNPRDRACATKLIELFMKASNADQFLSTAVYARERVNPYLFVYAASVAILHRPDTKNVPIPSHVQMFPKLYMDNSVFGKALEETSVVPDGSRMPIEVPKDYTGTDLDEEHRIAYWREDIGLNLHHWHWHLVYPFSGPREVVNKDRRGELFYYMHMQINARYNFERLCNGLLRVRRMNNLRDAIPEAYFPKLDSGVASRNYPARQPSSVLKDLNREADQLKVDIADMDRWRDRIVNAIYDGAVVDPQGRRVALTETEGIDLLGNIMESSTLSINPNIYGDFHNMGHALLSFVHDPDNRFLESFGPMGDPSTAMRDPVFYAWHANISEIFNTYKSTLTPYTTQELGFDGVRIANVELSTQGVPNNTFLTFWQQNDVNLARGMDFQPRGTIYARLTHLQHAPFTYRIRVDNSGQARQGTVRIFLAPRMDEKGASFLFKDQRTLFIEMDKFTVNLKSGSNTIERRSAESNVTVPYEQTFRDLTNRPTSGDSLQNFNFCGCGWPDHLLVPRGTADGFPAELFVMISDAKNDVVQQSQNVKASDCDDAQSYCGLRDAKYPDKRAMGFPLDRNPRSGVNTLAQFLTSNMAILNTTIRHNNRITASPNKTSGSNTSTNTNTNATSTTGNRQPTGNNTQSGSGNQNQGTNSQTGSNSNKKNQGTSSSGGGNRNQGSGGSKGGNRNQGRSGSAGFVEDDDTEV